MKWPYKTGFGIVFVLFLIIVLENTGFSANNPIATLTSFSGKVLIKSQESWAKETVIGLPLYSNDKVVTRVGTAIITFHDGTTLEIFNNSNVLIREKEKKKGIFKKVRVIERHVLLLLGKVFFKTGKEKVDLRLETSTALVGIRGTAGTLSIGPDGMTYIKFTEGRAAYTIGEFIEGIAEAVPVEIADTNPVQRASFVARAAADQLRRTEEKVSEGVMEAIQIALAEAIRDEAAARELLANGEFMMNSPDRQVRELSQDQIYEAKVAIESAKEAQREAIEAGADPTFKGFSVQDPGFDIPVKP